MKHPLIVLTIVWALGLLFIALVLMAGGADAAFSSRSFSAPRVYIPVPRTYSPTPRTTTVPKTISPGLPKPTPVPAPKTAPVTVKPPVWTAAPKPVSKPAVDTPTRQYYPSNHTTSGESWRTHSWASNWWLWYLLFWSSASHESAAATVDECKDTETEKCVDKKEGTQ